MIETTLSDPLLCDAYRYIDRLEARLKEAEGVIQFYGENNHWKTRQGGHIGNKNLKAVVCNDLGKKARAYMEKYKMEKYKKEIEKIIMEAYEIIERLYNSDVLDKSYDRQWIDELNKQASMFLQKHKQYGKRKG